MVFDADISVFIKKGSTGFNWISQKMLLSGFGILQEVKNAKMLVEPPLSQK